MTLDNTRLKHHTYVTSVPGSQMSLHCAVEPNCFQVTRQMTLNHIKYYQVQGITYVYY